MTSKVKITFIVPLALQKDLRKHVIKDNYGLRGKSRWVTEAIDRLLGLEDFPQLVRLNDEMTGLDTTETIIVERELKKRLGDAITQVRKEFPRLEGVQSRLVRTAILQRLLR